MSSLEGRIEWAGDDPTVVRLTDRGVRKVQISIREGRLRHFEFLVTVKDVDALIRGLEQARIWAKEGES